MKRVGKRPVPGAGQSAGLSPGELLRETQLPVDRKRREASMSGIRKAAEEKEILYRPDIWEMIRVQIKYVSPFTWAGQFAILLVILMALQQLKYMQAGFADYLTWFSVLSALIGVAGISELGRHVSFHMTELEQSCYFNLRQLWTMNMILFATVDILILSFLSAVISRRTGGSLTAVVVYMLVPFVLSNLCYLLLFTAARSGGRRYVQLGTAVSMGILAALPSVFNGAYKLNYLWVWILALSVGIVLMVLELRSLYGKFAKGEVLCWN